MRSRGITSTSGRSPRSPSYTTVSQPTLTDPDGDSSAKTDAAAQPCPARLPGPRSAPNNYRTADNRKPRRIRASCRLRGAKATTSGGVGSSSTRPATRSGRRLAAFATSNPAPASPPPAPATSTAGNPRLVRPVHPVASALRAGIRKPITLSIRPPPTRSTERTFQQCDVNQLYLSSLLMIKERTSDPCPVRCCGGIAMRRTWRCRAFANRYRGRKMEILRGTPNAPERSAAE